MLYQRRSHVLRRFFIALVGIGGIILLMKIFDDEIENVYHPMAVRWQCGRTKSTGMNYKHGFKQILMYTSWFGRYPWPLDSELKKRCPHKCLYTFNKCDLLQSDAVVFHEQDLVSSSALKRVAAYLGRNSSQRWVYYTHENPQNAKNNPASYNGVFNWTITYRRDSEVFHPYFHYRKIRSSEEIPKQHFKTNYAEGKKQLMVWASSHCNLWRDKVVKNLLNYLPITIIGKCARLFKKAQKPTACKKRKENCSDYFKTFKFYLAFENGLCFDYITEKYWSNSIKHGLVPIVLGSDYDSSIAIPGSYINALDFQNMEELANYLKYLDKNDTAYNEYFKWKKKYIITEPEQSWTCLLCGNLYNNSLPQKVYDNLGAFWGVESSCNRHEWKVQRLLST